MTRLLAVALLLGSVPLFAVATEGQPGIAPAAAPEEVVQLAPLPRAPITAPAATATEPAVRVTTTTAAPFDCASYVNSLPYEWLNLAPVHDAYRVTAQCMGWSLETVDYWETFIVEDVIRGESGGCWNIRGGVVMGDWLGCGVKKQGTKEDSGFGQLIGLWWRGPGTPVCDRLGLCSSDAIIASPWNSMRALLVAVEEDGRGPWCYDARARRYHPQCANVRRNWP